MRETTEGTGEGEWVGGAVETTVDGSRRTIGPLAQKIQVAEGSA
jgi:hypothetical protein